MINKHRSQSKKHPSPETLFLAIEGELAPDEVVRIDEHLRGCWDCRLESEQMRNGILAFMEFRKNHVRPLNEQPPHDWRTFSGLLDQAAQECEQSARQGFGVRFRGRLSATPRPAWIAATIAVLLAVLFVVRLVNPPIVSAREFLLRAAESRKTLALAARDGVIHQRVRIRHGAREITRDVYQNAKPVHVTAVRDLLVDGSRDSEAELQSVFASCGMKWDEPIDADVFAGWHEAIANKEDKVSSAGGGANQRITLATHVAGDNPVREASLTVLAMNWHPVEERLVLRDNSELVVTELALEIEGQPPAEIGSEPAAPAAVTPLRDAAAAAVNTAASWSEAELQAGELQARTALHKVGADLGEPIEILRTPNGHVQVEGLAADDARKAELMAALSGIPRVDALIRLQAGALPSTSAVPADAIPVTPAALFKPLLDGELTSRYPGTAERQEFVNNALANSQDSLLHAWALRRLAERYTAAEFSRLDAASRDVLGALLRDHMNAIRLQLAALQTALGSLAPSPQNSASTEIKTADWQTAALRTFTLVETLDQSWTVALVSASSVNPDAKQTSAPVIAGMQRLHAELESYLGALALAVPISQSPIQEH